MKRKLTKEEQKACRMGINGRKKTIAELEKELNYFNEFNAFNSKWAKYLEDKESRAKERKKVVIEATLKQLVQDIEDEKKYMSIEQSQLKFGVEIKKAPIGVN